MKDKNVTSVSIEQLKRDTKRILENKYFNLWMNRFGFESLDRKQKRFIMKQFWLTGTVSAGMIDKLSGAENLFFAPYAVQKYDLYYEPKIVQFINQRNVPFIPLTPQIVDETAVLGWCNSGRVPVKTYVQYYIDRMVEIELTLNTNILLQQMPFQLGITADKKKIADNLIIKLFNHEPAVITDVEDLGMIQAVVTNAPYVADKLRSLFYDYENQLYTILGVDNTKFDGSNKQFQLTSELDSNIAEINLYKNDIKTCVQEFVDDLNEVFGVNITLIDNLPDSESLYADQNEDEDVLQPGGNNENN